MANYSSPITVNGYSCRNCTDVDYAAKHIDPAHPRSGQDGLNAASDPTQPAAVKARLEHAKAARAQHDHAAQGYSPNGGTSTPVTPGRLVDIQA